MAASRPRPRAPACCAECPNRGARRRGDPKISEARDRIRSIRPDRGARRRPEVRFPFLIRNRARRFGRETAAPLPFGAPLSLPTRAFASLYLAPKCHWKAYFLLASATGRLISTARPVHRGLAAVAPMQPGSNENPAPTPAGTISAPR